MDFVTLLYEIVLLFFPEGYFTYYWGKIKACFLNEKAIKYHVKSLNLSISMAKIARM